MKWESCSDKLEKQDMKELLKHVNTLTQKQERELADSVLEVSVRANRHIANELRGGDSVCNALLELMGPEINKLVGEATKAVAEEVINEEAIKTATKMLKSGKFTIEEIHEFIPRLSIEKAILISLPREISLRHAA